MQRERGVTIKHAFQLLYLRFTGWKSAKSVKHVEETGKDSVGGCRIIDRVFCQLFDEFCSRTYSLKMPAIALFVVCL